MTDPAQRFGTLAGIQYFNDLYVALKTTVDELQADDTHGAMSKTDTYTSPGANYIEETIMGLDPDKDGVGLPAEICNAMEQLFSADFKKVRIHSGPYAHRLTGAHGAQAVTLGEHIYFGRGMYAPDTEEGLYLLIHELTHVMQYQQKKSFVFIEDLEDLEFEAQRIERKSKLFAMSESARGLLSIDPSNAGFDADAKGSTLEQESDGNLCGNLADFAVRDHDQRIKIQSEDGQQIVLTENEYRYFVKDIVNDVMERYEEELSVVGENEKEQMLLNYFILTESLRCQ